jgi:Tol biopolymer transport system component
VWRSNASGATRHPLVFAKQQSVTPKAWRCRHRFVELKGGAVSAIPNVSLGISTVLITLLMGVLTVDAKDRIILNRLGPSASELFVANADGTDERKLVSGSGMDYSPSFSHDGKWVVYTSERNGSADIYRVHVDGSGLERLTDNSAFDDQAALSPDGNHLAFVSTRSMGRADIWVLDLESHKLRRLTRDAGGNFRPTWSPDGRSIAFSSDRNTLVKPRGTGPNEFEQVQEASVYVIQADGTGLRRLTPAGLFAGSPTWSADGKRVAFYEMAVTDAYDARFGAFRPGAVSQIVAVDLTTGARAELSTGPGVKVAPQFVRDDVGYLLKDGEHAGLAFISAGFGAPGAMRSPRWSADGAHVVYQKMDYASPRQNQPLFSKNAIDFEYAWSELFPAFSRGGRLATTTSFDGVHHAAISVMDADGGHARPIFDEAGGMAFASSWSPDEQWIAFGFGIFFEGRTQPARIMIMRADGSDRRTLTDGSHNSGFPSFSPDGKRIVYRVLGEREQQGLRILTLADGAITTLTTGIDNFPSWSPTEDLIEFTRASGDAYDIFSIRPDGSNLRRLTMAPGNDAHGVWSPDGRHIVFSSARLGFKDESALYDPPEFQPYGELFIMNSDGSDQRPLTDNKDEDGTPAWQPSLPTK